MSEDNLKKQEQKVDIELKNLELSEKIFEIDKFKPHKCKIELEELNISKVSSLLNLLESIVLDKENTLLITEPKFKSPFNDDELEEIKKKIMSTIKKY